MRRRPLAAAALVGLALTACSHGTPTVHHAYTGRLHVSVVASANWTMQPAPKARVARQSVADARRRSQSAAAYVGTKALVYFGVFSGRDDAGVMHDRTPAWLVFAPATRRASVFADDLTQPWAAMRVTLPRAAVVA